MRPFRHEQPDKGVCWELGSVSLTYGFETTCRVLAHVRLPFLP